MTTEPILAVALLALVTAACDSEQVDDHASEVAPAQVEPRSCELDKLPEDWAATPVDVVVHSCEVVGGVADCCLAARVDAGLVAELEVRTADGVVPWSDPLAPDLGGLPTAWASDGSIVHGPISWNVCALPDGDERIAFHIRADDPEADPAAGSYWAYRIAYVGDGGTACEPPPVPSCSGCQ